MPLSVLHVLFLRSIQFPFCALSIARIYLASCECMWLCGSAFIKHQVKTVLIEHTSICDLQSGLSAIAVGL